MSSVFRLYKMTVYGNEKYKSVSDVERLWCKINGWDMWRNVNVIDKKETGTCDNEVESEEIWES